MLPTPTFFQAIIKRPQVKNFIAEALRSTIFSMTHDQKHYLTIGQMRELHIRAREYKVKQLRQQWFKHTWLPLFGFPGEADFDKKFQELSSFFNGKTTVGDDLVFPGFDYQKLNGTANISIMDYLLRVLLNEDPMNTSVVQYDKLPPEVEQYFNKRHISKEQYDSWFTAHKQIAEEYKRATIAHESAAKDYDLQCQNYLDLLQQSATIARQSGQVHDQKLAELEEKDRIVRIFTEIFSHDYPNFVMLHVHIGKYLIKKYAKAQNVNIGLSRKEKELNPSVGMIYAVTYHASQITLNDPPKHDAGSDLSKCSLLWIRKDIIGKVFEGFLAPAAELDLNKPCKKLVKNLKKILDNDGVWDDLIKPPKTTSREMKVKYSQQRVSTFTSTPRQTRPDTEPAQARNLIAHSSILSDSTPRSSPVSPSSSKEMFKPPQP